MEPLTTDSIAPDEQSVFLTQHDVDRLLEDDSAEGRIEVLEKITTEYERKRFTSQELKYAESIFRLLVQDTERKVRLALSQQLQHVAEVPRDIILDLARDEEEVASPLIENSPILSDADLIQIIENSREIGKLIAVANRGYVSARVSHSLVETHYPQVVQTLLENEHAQIDHRDLHAVMEEFEADQDMMQSLSTRDALPLPVVERLISRVSDTIAKDLEAKYGVDISDAKTQVRESVVVQSLLFSGSDELIEETILQMQMQDRLTPSVILSSLCSGHIRFFEIALAKMARISKANARKLIRDKGGLGFEAIYEKTQLPESTYEAILLLLGVVLSLEDQPDMQPGTKHYADVVVRALLEKAGNAPVENLSYIIALIRQSASHANHA